MKDNKMNHYVEKEIYRIENQTFETDDTKSLSKLNLKSGLL